MVLVIRVHITYFGVISKEQSSMLHDIAFVALRKMKDTHRLTRMPSLSGQ
jgi:hypothetical protein